MRVGDTVRLKLGLSRLRGPRRTAKIVRVLRDIQGGVVLDNPLDGQFIVWNRADLELVRKHPALTR